MKLKRNQYLLFCLALLFINASTVFAQAKVSKQVKVIFADNFKIDEQVHTGWIYATLAGNCLFIFLQMICLLDCCGSICASLERLSNRNRYKL